MRIGRGIPTTLADSVPGYQIAYLRILNHVKILINNGAAFLFILAI